MASGVQYALPPTWFSGRLIFFLLPLMSGHFLFPFLRSCFAERGVARDGITHSRHYLTHGLSKTSLQEKFRKTQKSYGL